MIVEFDGVVHVTGTPLLDLDVGGQIVQAVYTGGSGTLELSFRFTVVEGLNDADGIAIAGANLRMNGGTVRDAAGNLAALAVEAVPSNINYKVDTTLPGVGTLDFASGTFEDTAARIEAGWRAGEEERTA